MIRGYKSFRESKNNTDIKWGIDILTELEEVFIDLEDDLGFNIVPSIKIGENSYSTDGSIIFSYYRNSTSKDSRSKILISKDRVDLGQLEIVSDIIISKILSISGLVSSGVELDWITSMKVYKIGRSGGSQSQRTFNLYKNYKNGKEGLYWALPAYAGGNVSFSRAVKEGLLNSKNKFNVTFELVFNLIDR
jgi:hypothetical protein